VLRKKTSYSLVRIGARRFLAKPNSCIDASWHRVTFVIKMQARCAGPLASRGKTFGRLVLFQQIVSRTVPVHLTASQKICPRDARRQLQR
jgi:hypothetical protein